MLEVAPADWCAALGMRDLDVALGGRRLRVHIGGRGPALVLVHGNPTHGFLWRKALPDLLDRFTCFAIDLAGFGASTGPVAWTVAVHTDAVVRVVSALVPSDRPITWLAHDWGCAIALHATRSLPDRHHAVAITEGHLGWLPPWTELDPGFTALFSSLRHDPEGADFVVRRNAFVNEVLLGSLPQIGPDERAAYRRPFLEPSRRRAVLALARQVPVDGDPPSMRVVLDGVDSALRDPRTPILLMAADPGSVLDHGAVEAVRARATALTTSGIGRAEHFTPEQVPLRIARALLAWAPARR